MRRATVQNSVRLDDCGTQHCYGAKDPPLPPARLPDRQQLAHLRFPLVVLLLACAAVVFGVAGCSKTLPHPEMPPLKPRAVPWQSSPEPTEVVSSPRIALIGAKVMTAAGASISDGVVVMERGRIVAVGSRSEVSVDGAKAIDVTGKVITPGLIDTHSHMGVYPVPHLKAHMDGNEATAPVTAQVRAADSFWPQDPALPRAVAGGVTTIMVLPGSANLIGGEGVTLKLRPALEVEAMRFKGAPRTLKMACGENPKRVYGDRTTFPSTRMGNLAGYRAAYRKAQEYAAKFDNWQQAELQWRTKQSRYLEQKQKAEQTGDEPPEVPPPAPLPPDRDAGLETLVGVMNGEVLVQMHCYRADEMLNMLRIANEFGFKIRSFHHAVEAYKIKKQLAEADVAVSTWADWWGFKMEAFDSVVENLPLFSRAGGRAVMHSDSPRLVQQLNQEAAKAMYAARHRGIDVREEEALRWLTINPAWVLGVDRYTGSIEQGKMADVVVWSGSPFSVYSRVERVYIDGLLQYDRQQPMRKTDFELGLEVE